jgi:hypothetical protein
MLLRKNTSFHVSIYSIHKQLENMSKSPFYKTGISRSPLFKAGEYADTKRKQAVRKGQKRLTGEEAEEAMSPVKMNEGDISKKRRARRAAQMKEMEKKLNSMSIDENTIKPGMEKAYDKLSAKIDAHALKTTNLIRGTKYKS